MCDLKNKLMKQKVFDFNSPPNVNKDNFFVSKSNFNAYNFVLDESNLINLNILFGPSKSGKTHLSHIWAKKNNALMLKDRIYFDIVKIKKNIVIDDFLNNLDEELLFHLINHCFSNKLKILLTTKILISNYNFIIKDLSSRIKSFNYIEIKDPDDELIVNLIFKLLSDKQIIINKTEIFSYILKRINRTYNDIYFLVEKIDELSLEKNRELTIPLIRELI